MRVVHIVPAPAKRVGGIDGFLDGLNTALTGHGVQVTTVEAARRLALPEGDIFHFHGLWEPASTAIGATIKRRGGRYVVSPHGMLEPWAMRHRFWKKIPYFLLRESALLSGASELLATSEMERKNIQFWVKGSSPKVLPLGITERKFPTRDEARERLRWSETDKVMVFLSRLHPKKGLDMLLRALHAEPRIVTDGWRLVVVGDGDASYLRKLRDLQRELSSLPPIDWAGAVWDDRKWDYLAASDYFCLPSYSENFGLAVLESLACGTPVITTTATPWQMVADWPGCRIVSPTVAGLQQTLCDIAPTTERSVRSELAARAMESFGWNRLVERYVEFYSGVCAR